MDDLIKAFWGRFEIRMTEYGYSSLRNFCHANGLNYQVIAAARRKMGFPRLEDVIRFTEALDVDINALIYGEGFESVLEDREIKCELQKIKKAKIFGLLDPLLKADAKHLDAVEMILGIYREK